MYQRVRSLHNTAESINLITDTRLFSGLSHSLAFPRFGNIYSVYTFMNTQLHFDFILQDL